MKSLRMRQESKVKKIAALFLQFSLLIKFMNAFS